MNVARVNKMQYDSKYFADVRTIAVKASQLLKCSSCGEYLLHKIFLCENGHSICGNCDKTLLSCKACHAELSHIENIVLEQIAATTRIICIYADSGCDKIVLGAHHNLHASNCMHRSYHCRYTLENTQPCSWKGVSWMLIDHVMETPEHINKPLFQNDDDPIEICWNSKSFDSLIHAHQHLFYIDMIAKRTGSRKDCKIVDVTYWLVTYVGQHEDANNFKYEIMLSGAACNFKFNETCQDDSKTAEEYVELGKCIGVPENILEKFINPDTRELCTSVKIHEDF